MKSVIENVIKKGGYDLTKLLAKIDIFFAEDKITAEERDELYALARVSPEAQYDVKVEIEKLWSAVRALQNAPNEGATTDVKEWVQPKGAHDAYHKGDKILFTDGKIYISTMDNNVWSPSVYPSAWEVIE